MTVGSSKNTLLLFMLSLELTSQYSLSSGSSCCLVDGNPFEIVAISLQYLPSFFAHDERSDKVTIPLQIISRWAIVRASKSSLAMSSILTLL